MSYQITLCSPEMRKVIDKHKPSFDSRWENRLPFADLEVGHSFKVPIEPLKGTLQSLRVMSSTAGTLLHMRFKVIEHKDLAIIEVGRIE